jgi:RHS repeat-associated protein
VNRNTFAYPTTVTDEDGFQTLMKYKFEFGAVTSTQTPSPNVGHSGPIQTFVYDSVGRPQEVTNNINFSHVRWVYPNNSTMVQTFTTVVNGLGEAYSAQLFDGAGRVRATAADHPGSTGQYIGQYFTYNNMGRLVAQSNPTEMNSAWTVTGDDSTWYDTLQTYDWKGRPLVTTLPDGSTRENTYGGCGCAGGEVTTIRDERGRRRKYTMDVLGRLKQVDELNWNQTVYATTTYTYNPLDQLTQINQAGQIRSLAYDGYGRLQSRTTPEQGTTTYSYFADDAVQTLTDARGASTTLSYNNRGLVTGITYGVPAGVAVTPNVTFTYDAAGNRKTMTDGLGSMSYSYDQLSRLTSETRTFTGVGSFALSYAYNLGNEVTSITNPWSVQVGYAYDKIGRPTSVTGSGYGGVSSYVSSMSYRTFGLKQMNYSNGRALSLQYDNRLRLTSWSIPSVLRMQYLYEGTNGGRVTFARNQDDETLDRYFGYDHLGRLTVSRSGNEARLAIGEQVPLLYNGPYSQGYQYDQWGNITYRDGWGGDNPVFTATYTNNKRNGLTYDAAGNLTNDGGQTFTYDATGQQATGSYTGYLLQQYYDGNGLRVKKVEGGATTYYLRSTALGGQVVAEISSGGALQRGYVYLGGQLLAVQQSNAVSWIHQDPFVKSKRVTNGSGNIVSTIELDPWGGDTNRSSTAAFQPRAFTTYTRDGNAGDEAMFRRYNRWWSRFDQPDPYDGSHNLTDPQSFNRYAYVQNDPVNFVDPTGLLPQVCPPELSGPACMGTGFWGGGFNVNDRQSILNPSGRATIAQGFAQDVRYIQYTWSWYDDNTSTIHFYTLAPFAQRPETIFDQIFYRTTYVVRRNPIAAVIKGNAPSDSDPCAGVTAGDLDYTRARRYRQGGYQTAEQHIRSRHLSGNIKEASQYFGDFEAVKAYNRLTFTFGQRERSTTGSYLFILKFPYPIGTDRANPFGTQNSNVLRLGPDCRTVDTSHPGEIN